MINPTLNNFFFNTLQNMDVCTMSNGGIKNIYFGIRNQFGRDWFLTETNNPLQYGKIIGSSTNGKWYRLENFDNINIANEKLNRGKEGFSWTQTISIEFPKNSVEHRDWFEKLIYQKNIVFIIEDKNSEIYLLGESKGLKITDYNNQTGVTSSNNAYTSTFTGLERHPWRFVDINYFNTIVNVKIIPNIDKMDPIDNYCINNPLDVIDDICAKYPNNPIIDFC